MKNPIIRTIYLYLFALVGLAMLIIGTSMIINLGLKALIFTQADQQDRYANRPAQVYLQDPDMKTVEQLKVCGDTCELTPEQRERIDDWLVDYQEWQDSEKNLDSDRYILRNRQRQASTAISLILVGLPLWLFHWFTIKRDLRRKED
ncbi:MAG: hypothetical protein ABIA91_02020 [Patescibacteria group bacterium]